MKTIPTAPQSLLDGSQSANPQKTLRKIAAFAETGHNALHIVSDFDLTLTAGKQPGHNLGTWDVMDELMPPEGVQRHTEIYNSFRPIEIQGGLTEEVCIEKWSETLDLITSYRMSINDVRSAFLSVATLRDGAKEIFDVCAINSIPTVVLSSGITNVITIIADHYGIRPDHILSNTLEVDETGHVSGWRRDMLIHMMNKHEMGHANMSALQSSRPHTILLGDVPDDARMVTGDDHVLRVRVLDPRKGETHDQKLVLQKSFDAGYDLVVEDSLQPVAHIVRWIIAPDAV
jgi:phosphoserine phosphatase